MNLKLLTMTVLLVATASFASAKGHNQSATAVPGMDVGQETVKAAQTLGSAKGQRPDDKAPVTAAQINAGR